MCVEKVQKTLRDELHWRHLCVKDADSYRVPTRRHRVVLIVVRALLLLFLITFTVLYFCFKIQRGEKLNEQYELTFWSLFLTACAFIVAILHPCSAFKDTEPKWRKPYIVLQIATANVQMNVVLLYWTLVVPNNGGHRLDYFSYHNHLVVCLVQLVSVLLDHVPVHVINSAYASAFTVLYLCATVVFHATGARRRIYGSASDYSSDGALKFFGMLLVFLLLPLLTNLLLMALLSLVRRCVPSSSRPSAAAVAAAADPVADAESDRNRDKEDSLIGENNNSAS